VLWVYHPPLTVAIPALSISTLRRIPFVFAIHDMWPETLAATGMLTSTRMARGLAVFARLVYERAAALIVISGGFKNNLIHKGVPPEKIHVIPNWADEDIYRPVPKDEFLGRTFGLAGKFNILYGGNLGAAQALDN